MGRPVKLRVSYTAELRHLLRLKEAIELDRRDPKWSGQAIELLAELANLFMAGPHIPRENGKKENRQSG